MVTPSIHTGKIFIDLDGVMADFWTRSKELTGIAIPDNDAMWHILNKVPHYFDTLDIISGAKDLFDQLYQKYGPRCEILTALPKPKRNMPTSHDDKIAWVRRTLSKTITINIVVQTAHKQYYCTNTNDILIDDSPSNIAEWHLAGGIGILCKNLTQVMAELRERGIL